MIPSPPQWIDREQLKEIFGEPGSNREYEMLKAPHDNQHSHPRVACAGYVDEMTAPEEDTLTFGVMEWSTVPRNPNIVFYANGFSFMAIDRDINNPRFRVANRLNNRLKKKPHIHSIFVTTRKQQ